jgi:hypothetical protein
MPKGSALLKKYSKECDQATDQYSQLKWPRQPVTTTKQQNLWKAALEAAFTSSGRILQQPLGKWTGPRTQVWQSFYNPQTEWVVTSTNGSVPLFTEYKVHQQTWHHVDATHIALASVYMSLDDVDCNIMVPMTVNWTSTSTIVTSFHETVETSHDMRPAYTFSDYIATYLSTSDALWIYSRGQKNPENLPRTKHVIESGDQRILQYGKRNGIIWMGVDRK